MSTHLNGARIRAQLSQQDLARLFGFKDRQTVSAIENGERRVSAEELILAVEKLGQPLDYFTNPFMLVGEGKFSWRQTHVGALRLDAYERSPPVGTRRSRPGGAGSVAPAGTAQLARKAEDHRRS